MDVAWQDSVGSFLDSSGTDTSAFSSFASDGAGALWSSSADGPLFSAQPVLWDSGADSPIDSAISALTADSSSGTDASALLAGSWLVDVGSQFAGFSVAIDGGLLWTASGTNTSSSLTSNSGLGLGALDLGAASGASQWQQFIDQFAGASAIGLADVPQLLWMGAGSQAPVTLSVPGGLQSLPGAASGSLPLAGVGNLAPAQLTWTQPSAATGLIAGPSLTDAAPTPPLSGAGMVGSVSSNLPIAGVGSH